MLARSDKGVQGMTTWSELHVPVASAGGPSDPPCMACRRAQASATLLAQSSRCGKPCASAGSCASMSAMLVRSSRPALCSRPYRDGSNDESAYPVWLRDPLAAQQKMAWCSLYRRMTGEVDNKRMWNMHGRSWTQNRTSLDQAWAWSLV